MTSPSIKFLCVALLNTFCISLSVPTAVLAQEKDQTVRFLTVRDPGSPDGPSTYFGDARSTLRAGRCAVQEIDTGSLSELIDGGPTFVREQLLRIDQVSVAPPDEVLAEVRETASGAMTLYVHGYYIDFEKGCRRAALLQRNADLSEKMVWFSWPSDGDIANYASDESDLYWSVPDIADAILELNNRSDPSVGANVIGHSLGARGVALALREIAFKAPETRLGNVVLIAGDMDFEIFARMLPRIEPIARQITLYVSDQDRPLALSAQLHGYQRIGQSGNDLSLLPSVEVIDVSQLPNESASGHLYHIHKSVVGRDLDLLLNDGLPAKARQTLKQTGPNTWDLMSD